MAKGAAVIGYDVTIKLFVEMDNDLERSARDIEVLRKLMAGDASTIAHVKAISRLLKSGEMEINLKRKQVKIVKPRNDASRVIDATGEMK